MLSDTLFVDHCANRCLGQRPDLRYLMRGPKAVEEEQERDPGPERRRVRYQGKILCFLNRGGTKQGESGCPGRHDVAMIAKDRKSLRGKGARRDVQNKRRKFPSNFVHVWNKPCEAVKVVLSAPV